MDSNAPFTVSIYPAGNNASKFEKFLNDSINFKLILNEAENLNIAVTDDEVEKQIQNILNDRKATRADLDNFLRNQGQTIESYKNDLKNQMLFMRFRGRKILPLIKITDKDIQSYYIQKTGSTADAINLYLRQIFIKIPQGASNEVTQNQKEKADQAYQKLKDGGNFVEIEKIYSEARRSSSQQNLVVLKPKDLNSKIRNEIQSLDEGQFSNIIETSTGYYIFQLEKRQFDGGDQYKSYRQELEQELRQKEIARFMLNWLKKARNQAKINVVTP